MKLAWNAGCERVSSIGIHYSDVMNCSTLII